MVVHDNREVAVALLKFLQSLFSTVNLERRGTIASKKALFA